MLRDLRTSEQEEDLNDEQIEEMLRQAVQDVHRKILAEKYQNLWHTKTR